MHNLTDSVAYKDVANGAVVKRVLCFVCSDTGVCGYCGGMGEEADGEKCHICHGNKKADGESACLAKGCRAAKEKGYL